MNNVTNVLRKSGPGTSLNNMNNNNNNNNNNHNNNHNNNNNSPYSIKG